MDNLANLYCYEITLDRAITNQVTSLTECSLCNLDKRTQHAAAAVWCNRARPTRVCTMESQTELQQHDFLPFNAASRLHTNTEIWLH